MNDCQKQAYEIRKQLPALTMAQLNWVVGQDYERIKVDYDKTRKKVQSYDYYGIVTTFKGWQICRYVIVHSSYSRNGYSFGWLSEVSQRWMRVLENGHIDLAIFEKRYAQYWYKNSQPYSIDSPMLVKDWSSSYERKNITQINLSDGYVYPIRRFSNDFKERNLARACCRYDEIWLFEDVLLKKTLKDVDSLSLDKREVLPLSKKCYLPTIVETLFKMGEPDLAHFMMHRDGWEQSYFSEYWMSFLIAHRHGLRMKNLAGWMEWLDYVKMLDNIGRDIRSPHYLVPAEGVAVAHDRCVVLMDRQRAKVKAEEDRKLIKKHEEGYRKRMQSYFGLAIVTESGITITPLKSVQDFYDEGQALHHCVYDCGYYAKESSICFTARDKDGRRVETIEVDLESLKVLQSRGLQNKPTAFHKEILKAMEDNMWRIGEVADNRIRIAS